MGGALALSAKRRQRSTGGLGATPQTAVRITRRGGRGQGAQMMAKPIPEGYRSVNVILTVDEAAKAIDFYKQAFGAKEISRLPMGDKIGHAELQIGDTRIMLNDEFPDSDNLGPKSRGGTTVGLVLYVDDVDTAFQEAIQAGGTEKMPVEDRFWGDRMGTLTDPFGHQWSIATHVEDVPPEQFEERMAQSQKQTQSEPA
jgi:PhnB protein